MEDRTDISQKPINVIVVKKREDNLRIRQRPGGVEFVQILSHVEVNKVLWVQQFREFLEKLLEFLIAVPYLK